MEFQRVDLSDFMFMKTIEVVWKENHGKQDIGIFNSEGNIVADKEINIDNLGEIYRILRST